MREIVLIAVSGAMGSVCRYLVSGWSYSLLGDRFAYGTLVVNIIGCFLVGFIMEVGIISEAFSRATRIAITIGFLGAFTTFSTLGYETIRYIEDGAMWLAFANVASHIVLGGLAVWVGLIAGKSMLGGI